MTYEELLIASDGLGLIAKEKDLQAYDGRIKGNHVAIRKSIQTHRQKACVLAEELGHYFTSSGDLLNDDEAPLSIRQERRARLWAYDVQIGLSGLIKAKEAGCSTPYQMAEYFDVTQEFLTECLQSYHEKYGTHVKYGDHIILFDPHLEVLTKEDFLRKAK